jgi:hypothetical protein
MDKYYEAFKNIRGNRDIVFETVLDYFDKRPINILEIGCARNLDIGSRQSDGWSTCFWADYLYNNGGNLFVFDIDENSTKNCETITNHWLKHIDYDIDSFYVDISNRSVNKFDFRSGINLAFLDGGDDPKETLAQLQECKKNKIELILIDDFHTKGRLITDKPDTRWIWGNGHQMAAFGKLKLGEVNLEVF